MDATIRSSILDTPDDLRWLQDTHGVDTTGAAVAEVFGNEDCPQRVHVYAVNDYRERPTVWVLRGDTLVRAANGEAGGKRCIAEGCPEMVPPDQGSDYCATCLRYDQS